MRCSVRASAVYMLLVAGLCLPGAGCGNADLGGFVPPPDPSAICQIISPGSEIAVRVGFGGRALKLNWENGINGGTNLCTIQNRNGVETLTLVARNLTDGFISGDSNAIFTLVISRENGLAVADDYRDSKLTAGQQPGAFDVALSSSPSVNCIPLRNGNGSARVLEILRAGDRVAARIAFTIRLLNLTNNTLQDVCGEAFFDGNVITK